MRNLSEHQRILLSYICLGWNTRQISEFLGVSPYTIKNTLGSILSKMESRSYKDAGEKALELGIVRLEDIPKAVKEYEFA